MINKENALVSVVVPVFNNADTIAETIESVLSQTYSNWELICVDDGSTDEGEAIIQRYCEQDKRILFLTRTKLPKGGSMCRNIGAFASKGDYLIFLDGDDLLTNTCLENRLKVIEHTNANFAVFPMASFKDNPLHAQKCSRTDVKDMKYYFASAQGGWQVTSPIWRSEYFKSLGGFNEAFPRLQDIELHMRAILQSGDNYIVRDDAMPDSLYRLGANHYSAVKLQKGLNAHRLFFQLLRDNIKQFDKKNKRSTAILNNFCSIFVGLNILKTHGYDVSEFDDLVNDSLINYFGPFHKLMYKLFKSIYGYKAGFISIKMARKILLERFILFS